VGFLLRQLGQFIGASDISDMSATGLPLCYKFLGFTKLKTAINRFLQAMKFRIPNISNVVLIIFPQNQHL
jgi:hypothetical protein